MGKVTLFRVWLGFAILLFAAVVLWDGLVNGSQGYLSLWAVALTRRNHGEKGQAVLILSMSTGGFVVIVSMLSWAICSPAWTAAVRLLGHTKSDQAADYDDD